MQTTAESLILKNYLEETVTLLEEEVIVDELLLDFLGHASQWVVGTLQLSLQTGKGGRDFVFHLLVLSLSQAGVEGVSLHRATATNASGNDVLTLFSFYFLYKLFQFELLIAI